MADGRQAAGSRPPRAPMPRRSRRRWAAAAAAAACWALLIGVSGSVIAGTAVLLLLAAIGVAGVVGLRSMGVDSGHPWVRQMAARPWRDPQDVLRIALRHTPDVFVLTPAGDLLAPVVVQLRLSPRDFDALAELMGVSVISSSAAEVYEDEVAARGARFAGSGPAEVTVVSDPALAPGRYALRQGRPPQPAVRAAAVAGPGNGFRHAHDGRTRAGADPSAAGRSGAAVRRMPQRGPSPYGAGLAGTGLPETGMIDTGSPGTVITGLPTVTERVTPVIPQLTLVTAGSVTRTRTSGARAGRGAVDLVLPDVPTVSREHARFTFVDGQWRVANLGRNGLTVNGIRVDGGQALRDGDTIGWGMRPDAPVSRVEIG